MPLQCLYKPSTSSTVTPVAMTSEVPRSSRWSPEHREVPGAGGGWPGQSCGGWSDAADHRSSKRAAEEPWVFWPKAELIWSLALLKALLGFILLTSRLMKGSSAQLPMKSPSDSLVKACKGGNMTSGDCQVHLHQYYTNFFTPILHQYCTCVCVFSLQALSGLSRRRTSSIVCVTRLDMFRYV